MKTLSIRTILFVSVAALLSAVPLNTKALTGKVGLIRLMPTFSVLKIKTSGGGTIEDNLTMSSVEPDFC